MPKIVRERKALQTRKADLILDKQVKSLVASKRRDATDVQRDTGAQTSTTISCLTSSTAFATAASGTGLLEVDGDECQLNTVQVRGGIQNPAVLDLDPTGNVDVLVRHIIVYFNKPLLVASAAGTLPPITEVLVSDDIHSQFVTATANAGRFVVLSDRRFNLGTNSYQAATALGHARNTGVSHRHVNYVVKVNKRVKFAANAVSTTPAGHYDSDVPAGRVSKGLLVMYNQAAVTGGATVSSLINTRLNYTG